MCLVDILKKCEEEGYPIGRMGLYIAGKREGFLSKKEGQFTYDFDKEKFLKWLHKAKEKAPEGWVTVKDLCSIFNISLAQAYVLIKDEKSGAKNFGSGKGVLYVEPKRIEEIIKERKGRHKINWGN